MSFVSGNGFELQVLASQVWDEHDDNVDVEVVLTDGRRFTATVFTLQNIKTLLDRFISTGDCGGGLFFWSVEMIIVKRLTVDVLVNMVQTLISDEHFEMAFTYQGNKGASK